MGPVRLPKGAESENGPGGCPGGMSWGWSWSVILGSVSGSIIEVHSEGQQFLLITIFTTLNLSGFLLIKA